MEVEGPWVVNFFPQRRVCDRPRQRMDTQRIVRKKLTITHETEHSELHLLAYVHGQGWSKVLLEWRLHS